MSDYFSTTNTTAASVEIFGFSVCDDLLLREWDCNKLGSGLICLLVSVVMTRRRDRPINRHRGNGFIPIRDEDEKPSRSAHLTSTGPFKVYVP